MTQTRDSAALGNRIAAARDQAGLTQADLAAEVALERSAIAKIERGLRKISAFELSSVAHALGRRMEWFLSEPPPAIVSHRSPEGLATEESTIDGLLEDLAREVEFVTSLDSEFRLPAVDPQEKPQNSRDAERLAQNARQLLGFNIHEPIPDLVGAVAHVGLVAFAENLGADTADAGTVLLREGGVCLVNSHLKVGRRRLALAHEFGHFLVADDYTVDWRVGPGEGSDTEALLDRSARALLLPTESVTVRWTELRSVDAVRASAVRCASEFRVDMATLARRVEEVEAASAEEASQIRAVRTTKADIIEHDLYVPTDLEGTTVPPAYAQAVLRLLRREEISRERALELLRGTFEDTDLPEAPSGLESEIWKYVS